MIALEKTLLSDEIFTECFCCDLNKCKGCCCIEGDAGAPLEEEELPLLEKYFPIYKKYMSEAGLSALEKHGELFDISLLDGSFLTPLIQGRDCVYLTKEENGIASCAIEKAYLAKEIDFRKPISCHLFPIRIQTYPQYDAVNYFHWSICKEARILGKRKKIPVFQFLKEPLLRKYGQAWYKDVEMVYLQYFGEQNRSKEKKENE
ncbi:MAG: DUF3109 family protein [Bacteroidales bacterium]